MLPIHSGDNHPESQHLVSGVFEKINYQQVEQLYNSTSLAVLATLLNAGVLAAVLWPVVDQTLILTWLAGMLCITSYRGILSHQFYRQDRAGLTPSFWAGRFAIGSSIAGAGWGVAAFLLFPDGHITHQIFLAFIIAGMAAGAATSLSVIFSVASAFLFLMLIPLGVRLLMTADPMLMTMGVMTFVFMVFLLGSARRIANNTLGMIQSREAAEDREKELSRFKSTLDMTMDCIFMYDPTSLKFTYVNEGALAHVGYSHKELMRMTPFDIMPEYDEEKFRQIIQPMIDGENDVINIDTIHKHKDGSLIPVEIVLQYVNLEGEAARFVAIVRDVTNHNELMRDMRSYANALAQLHEISTDQTLPLKEKIERVLALGIEVFDLKIGIVSDINGEKYRVEYIVGPEGVPSTGSIFQFNETYCFHTYLANAPTGFHAAGESDIKDHPCYINFKLESYLGAPIIVDGKRQGTLNFSSPEKHKKPFSLNNRLLIQLLAEWIGNELSRQSKDAVIYSVLDTVMDGIVIITHQGVIETVNPAAEKIFGYSSDELVGKNISILMPEQHSADHDQYLEKFLKTGDTKVIGVSREFEGRRKDGSLFPIEIGISEMHIGDRCMFTGILRDISDRKKIEAELKYAYKGLLRANGELEALSLEDGLTRIANRRHFDATLKKEHQIAIRNNASIALILCDIDYFKQYNDHYGHGAGDECLIRVAQSLQKIPTRPNDLVARYGGEEFVVILQDTELKGASVVAENMRQAVWDLNIPHCKSHAADRVTMSLGVVAICPRRNDHIKEILKQVDEALYGAKSAGRNQVQTISGSVGQT